MSVADAALADSPTPSLERLRSIVEAGQAFLAAVDCFAKADPPIQVDKSLDDCHRDAFVWAGRLSRAFGGRKGDSEVRRPTGLPKQAKIALIEMVSGFERLIGNEPGGWGLRVYIPVESCPPTISDEMRYPDFGHLTRRPFSTDGKSGEEFEALRSHVATLSNYLETLSARDEPIPSPVGKALSASVDEPSDVLTLDDRACVLLTKCLKNGQPKLSKRGIARDLKCHHSSLEDCPTFLRLWESSKNMTAEGYLNAKSRNIEAKYER